MPDLSRLAEHVTPHSTDRLEIVVDAPFGEVRARFEQAVPPLDLAAMTELADRNASWDEVEATVAADAPHDFLIYATVPGSLMEMAGHDTPAVEYLMGNHVIAERMFRHQPDTLLYAPLRVLLRGTPDGRAAFVLDRPSMLFTSLGDEAVAAVGRELDDKVAALLTVLGAVPR